LISFRAESVLTAEGYNGLPNAIPATTIVLNIERASPTPLDRMVIINSFA
jgi:hypothetical protein